MSIALGSLAVTAAHTYTYNVGARATVGAVVVLNESPYGLNVSNGASSQWIAAQTADLVPCDSMGFNGNLTITTDGYLTNASNAPSFLVLFTAYAPGEQIRGIYPSPLARLTNGAIGVATQLVNDGNTAGARIIEATPGAEPQSYVIVNNDGTFNVSYKSPSLGIVQSFISGTTPDAQYGVGFQVSNGLFVFGHTQLDAGGTYHIITDGNGNITQVNNVNSLGTVTATAPMKLAANFQETGVCGGLVQSNGAGSNYGWVTNFKTHTTNTPTGITLSVIAQSNVTSTGLDFINTNGFALFVSSTAAGFTKYYANYTTAGNCLLAVDTSAQTFDHHCDPCGHVSQAVPFGRAQMMNTSEHVCLSYTCPACGVTEYFNTDLTTADEADTTPQGSGQYASTRGAQASLIRSLMIALGLAVQA